MSSNESLFPFKPTLDVTDDEPKRVDLFSDEAEEMLNILGSNTARRVLRKLNQEPATKSEIAEYTETSVQNAKYHVDRMQAAGLIKVIGTHYSARGVEMDVYALNGSPLLLIGGDDEDGTSAEVATDETSIQPAD